MGEAHASSERIRSTEASSSERLQAFSQAPGHYRRFSSDALLQAVVCFLASTLPAVSTAHCTVALLSASWRASPCREHMD